MLSVKGKLAAALHKVPPWADAWRFHGWWTPGVVLMRNLSLRWKAVVLLVCTLTPTLVLLGFQCRASLKAYDEAQVAARAVELSVAAVRLMDADLLGDRTGADAFSQTAAGHAGADPRVDAMAAELLGRSQAYRNNPSDWRTLQALGAAQRQLRDFLAQSARPEGADWHRIALLVQGPLDAGDPMMAALQELALRASHSGATAADLNAPLAQLRPLAWRLRPSLDRLGFAAQASTTTGQPLVERIDALASVPWSAPASSAAAVEPAWVAAQAQATMRELAAVRVTSAGVLLAQMQARVRDAASAARELILGAAIVLVLECYLLWSIYRVLAGGLVALCAHADRLAHGDLRSRPHGWGRDEIGRSLNALGQTASRMSSLLNAVSQGVGAVSHASREVASGNAGLSVRTSDIGQAISEVTRRTQGFSDAMQTCVVEVEQAAENIRSVHINAQRSSHAVSGLRDRMQNLQGKSREISHVVGLVEAVAYQTKLLSLNASVEASRAGEAGRGFAVVAQEVRALAQRSEDAAHKINSIIKDSVEEIGATYLLADHAGEAVRLTHERIDAVNQFMSSVVQQTHASMNESQEVLGITRAVEESVRSNSRVVEQLSNASSSLREQGDNLKRSVQHFVLS